MSACSLPLTIAERISSNTFLDSFASASALDNFADVRCWHIAAFAHRKKFGRYWHLADIPR